MGVEFVELPLEIDPIPEKRVIPVFAPEGPDQSLHAWVRHRDMGNRLDLLGHEGPWIGEPPVNAESWAVFGADLHRRRVTGNDLIEHAAHRRIIDVPAADAESDDTAGTHIGHHEGLMTHNGIDSQRNRSTRQRLSLVCAKMVSQKGPEAPGRFDP
jgi:hypothetical protein